MRNVIALTLGSAFALSSVAHAGSVLVSPVMRAQSGAGGALVCRILNVSSKPITVRIAIVRFDGAVSNSPSDVTVAPAQAILDFVAGDFDGYCQFSGGFSKNDVRASAENFEGGRSIVVVPAN